MKTVCHINVKGSVQGVGFRYFCREIAARLGLTGFVMNIPDGSVDITVSGDKTLIDEFIGKISGQDGPYLVSGMEKNVIPEKEDFKDFQILQYPG